MLPYFYLKGYKYKIREDRYIRKGFKIRLVSEVGSTPFSLIFSKFHKIHRKTPVSESLF